jgi:hypothetical protein
VKDEEGWGGWARRMVFGQEQRTYKRRERWREEKGSVRVRNGEAGWVEIERIS